MWFKKSKYEKIQLSCKSCCTHGGVCILDKDHDGLHDSSGHCQWTDEEAISKEEADERFLMEAKFQGFEFLAEFIIDTTNALEKTLKESNE